MCWMCHYQDHRTASYRACDCCRQVFQVEQLQQYDLLKRWKSLMEWIEFARLLLICGSCTEAMDNFKERVAERTQEEPDVIELPEPRKRWPEPRDIVVGILDGELLGLRCAKRKYGVEVVEEILEGFVYRNEKGFPIGRATLVDCKDTMQCKECMMQLWECNAREVNA